MDMETTAATLKDKLGVDIGSGENLLHHLITELHQIAHTATTTAVPSDLALLRSRAAIVAAHLRAAGDAVAPEVAQQLTKLGAGFSALEEAQARLWRAHGELAAKHDALEAHVTAPPAAPAAPPAPVPEPEHAA